MLGLDETSVAAISAVITTIAMGFGSLISLAYSDVPPLLSGNATR